MWYKIIQILDWFGEMNDRYKLIRDFNSAAKESFISGQSKSLLEAKITRGDGDCKHAFSKFISSGFRIKVMGGNVMYKSELIEVGKIILDNDILVRKLISLGWDTLEVEDNKGNTGCKWCLSEYANIGGLLNQK
jgi:hypothetical protein